MNIDGFWSKPRNYIVFNVQEKQKMITTPHLNVFNFEKNNTFK